MAQPGQVVQSPGTTVVVVQSEKKGVNHLVSVLRPRSDRFFFFKERAGGQRG
jgi:hypothetical protein